VAWTEYQHEVSIMNSQGLTRSTLTTKYLSDVLGRTQHGIYCSHIQGALKRWVLQNPTWYVGIEIRLIIGFIITVIFITNFLQSFVRAFVLCLVVYGVDISVTKAYIQPLSVLLQWMWAQENVSLNIDLQRLVQSWKTTANFYMDEYNKLKAETVAKISAMPSPNIEKYSQTDPMPLDELLTEKLSNQEYVISKLLDESSTLNTALLEHQTEIHTQASELDNTKSVIVKLEAKLVERNRLLTDTKNQLAKMQKTKCGLENELSKSKIIIADRETAIIQQRRRFLESSEFMY